MKRFSKQEVLPFDYIVQLHIMLKQAIVSYGFGADTEDDVLRMFFA